MPVQDTPRHVASDSLSSNVIQLPGQRPKESWELMKDWADQRGWGSYKCAGAMILAATPQEKKSLPDQHTLCGQWRRWLKGETIPDGHRGDPNADGFYRPIIARMMGATPDRIWPAARWSQTGVKGTQGELKFRRNKTAARLKDLRSELADLQERLRHIPELEHGISRLQAEMAYLDAMLAIPVPEDIPAQRAQR